MFRVVGSPADRGGSTTSRRDQHEVPIQTPHPQARHHPEEQTHHSRNAVDGGLTFNSWASSSGSRAELSKIYGHEVLALPMFFHYARAEWYWTNNLITSATPFPDRWGNDNWHTHPDGNDEGDSYSNGNSTYSYWVQTEFHSDGYPTNLFPDVAAESTVTINVHAGGGYDCDFEWTEGENSYPNLQP